MENEVLKWGGIAGAVGAIGGVIAKVVNWGKKRKEKKSEFQNEVLASLGGIREQFTSFKKDIKEELADVKKDVAVMQCTELKQSYDKWMELGYCPTETKSAILAMYDRYHDVNHNNSLAEGFKEQLQDLPPNPPATKTASQVM